MSISRPPRDEPSVLYFAYGANLPSRSFLARCPGALPYSPGVLPDHRLEFNFHATVVPAVGQLAAGALWLVTPAHLASLDRFEGYPRYYRRERVSVETDHGQFAALVYVMNRPGLMAPAPDYLRLLYEGYQEWLLPVSLLEQALARVGARRRKPHLIVHSGR